MLEEYEDSACLHSRKFGSHVVWILLCLQFRTSAPANISEDGKPDAGASWRKFECLCSVELLMWNIPECFECCVMCETFEQSINIQNETSHQIISASFALILLYPFVPFSILFISYSGIGQERLLPGNYPWRQEIDPCPESGQGNIHQSTSMELLE